MRKPKNHFMLFVLPIVFAQLFSPTSAIAQTTALERAQAFVCVSTGDCMLPYSRPEVQKALVDLAEIENDCRPTTRGNTSIPDRIGFARARMDVFQDLMVLMLDFKPIVHKYCSSIGIDDLLKAYAFERDRGGSHSGTISALLVDPKHLLMKSKGKNAAR
jgi:hypothetical protein